MALLFQPDRVANTPRRISLYRTTLQRLSQTESQRLLKTCGRLSATPVPSRPVCFPCVSQTFSHTVSLFRPSMCRIVTYIYPIYDQCMNMTYLYIYIYIVNLIGRRSKAARHYQLSIHDGRSQNCFRTRALLFEEPRKGATPLTRRLSAFDGERSLRLKVLGFASCAVPAPLLQRSLHFPGCAASAGALHPRRDLCP